MQEDRGRELFDDFVEALGLMTKIHLDKLRAEMEKDAEARNIGSYSESQFLNIVKTFLKDNNISYPSDAVEELGDFHRLLEENRKKRNLRVIDGNRKAS